MSFDPLRPIGADIQRELSRFGPAAGLREVVEAWPESVGDAIAANAWPARIARDGTLHVATSSSAWAFELTHLASSVHERLASRLGDSTPAALRFAPGPLPERGGADVEASPRTVPEPTEADRAAAEQIAQGIEGPALREVVARAAEASLAAGSNRTI